MSSDLSEEVKNMPLLIVKFEGSVLQKVRANGGAITIGRGPDNSIPIDNLAVSSRHAQIKSEQGRLVIEDLDSLNGTFVNNQRVKRAALKSGDVVMVGKHSIYVDETDRGEAPPRGRQAILPAGQERGRNIRPGHGRTPPLDAANFRHG